MQCVAASVYGHQGQALAAMSVSMLSQSLDDARLAQIVTIVRESALELSRALGYRGSPARAPGDGTEAALSSRRV